MPAKFGRVRERQSMKLLRSRLTWGAGMGTAVVAAGGETVGPRTVESWRAEEEDIPAAAARVSAAAARGLQAAAAARV